MTLTTAYVLYDRFKERVHGVEVAPGFMRLTSFSTLIPLCPGDQVSVRDGLVQDVHQLRDDLFVVIAFFRLNTEEAAVEARAADWGRSTDVEKPTALTIQVASPSRQWIEDVVLSDPLVVQLDIARLPGQDFDFAKACQEV